MEIVVEYFLRLLGKEGEMRKEEGLSRVERGKVIRLVFFY